MNPVSPKTATCLFRESVYYRKIEFLNGLRRHGFQVSDRHLRHPQPGDVLLLWNRPRPYEHVAAAYESAGATVIVAENGYLGQPEGGGKYYALALDRHNGAGRWYAGDRPRYEVKEDPWRKKGNHILVLPQRGIGSPGVRMPSAWTQQTMKRLEQLTDRPIRLRPHPGHKKLDPAPDLVNCHAAVTWGSGAGIKAIRAGIPVFFDFEKWIGASGAARLGADLEACNMPDRTELWRRITWAQWSIDEISSGEAFDGLLNAEDSHLLCA